MASADGRAMKANVSYFYVYSLLANLQFFVPVYIAFLLARGLSFTQVLSLEAVYSVLCVILEVPTGYFADVKGRKLSLLVASASFAVALAIFALGKSFWEFSLSMVLWAVAASFQSGADSALLYDSLLSNKQEKTFPKVIGRAGSIGLVSVGIASLIGGYVANIKMTLPFVLSILAAVAMTLVALRFKEPLREKPLLGRNHIHKLIVIAKEAVHNKAFVILTGYSIFFIPIWVMLFYLIQPLVVQLGLPLSTLGILYACLTFIGALGMLAAHRLHGRLSLQLFIIALVSALGIFFVFRSTSWIGLVWFLPVALVFGISNVAISSAMNDTIKSHKRATTLSISSMISRLFTGGISAAIGPFLDHYQLRSVTMVLAVISLVGCTFFAALLVKKKI